jgi:hypothetical protein
MTSQAADDFTFIAARTPAKKMAPTSPALGGRILEAA